MCLLSSLARPLRYFHFLAVVTVTAVDAGVQITAFRHTGPTRRSGIAGSCGNSV